MPSLYGEFPGVINRGASAISRRAVVAGALALPVAARAQAVNGEGSMLRLAMAAMGGRALLERVRAISWLEWGHEPMGRRVRMEPFGTVRVQGWMFALPETKWFEPREYPPAAQPVSDPQETYSIQHFGLFSHMLLVHSAIRERGRRLTAEHPGYSPAKFVFARDGKMLRARHDIIDRTGRHRVTRLIEFDGEVSDQGIRWPGSITIREGSDAPTGTNLGDFKVELN